jgi:hypothetical protein
MFTIYGATSFCHLGICDLRIKRKNVRFADWYIKGICGLPSNLLTHTWYQHISCALCICVFQNFSIRFEELKIGPHSTHSVNQEAVTNRNQLTAPPPPLQPRPLPPHAR